MYHLVMTNIAMENPTNTWRFLAGKIIYFYGPFSMAMLNNQMVTVQMDMLIYVNETKMMMLPMTLFFFSRGMMVL